MYVPPIVLARLNPRASRRVDAILQQDADLMIQRFGDILREPIATPEVGPKPISFRVDWRNRSLRASHFGDDADHYLKIGALSADE